MAVQWREIHNRHRAVDISSEDDTLPHGTTAVVCTGTAANIVLADHIGTEHTYPAAVVTAMGHVIPGNWSKVVRTGTAASSMAVWYRAT